MSKKINRSKEIKKGDPIIVPNAEDMTKEEIERYKHNERMRRYMARRKGKEVMERQKKQEIRKMSQEEMVEKTKDTRNLAIEAIQTKLQDINSDPEELKKINLGTLATVFGILYDKTQLMDGLATENIAVKAQIDVNMGSDKAIEELNRMREKYQKEKG